MKKITQSIVTVLLIAAMSGNAFADGGRGGPPPTQRGYYQGHGHGSDWVGPLILFGIAAAALGAIANPPSPPPPPYWERLQPNYIEPPVVMPAPQPALTNVWYYCRALGQYYPYTRSCPEEWQLVSPTPQ